MNNKLKVWLGAGLLASSGALQAHQEADNDGKFSVLFGGGKYFTDNDRDLGDGNVGEIGIGYIIDKHWALEAIYSDISQIEDDITGSDVDGDMYRLDALYHFDQNGHWTPYLALGVGKLTFDPKGPGSTDSETAVNFGGGIKYAMSTALSVRGDVRGIVGDDGGDVDGLASVAFNYVFGAQAVADPLDSDGDGVLDINDRCPGTPAGVTVDAEGCPLDSDGDGVPDYLDKCPDTQADLRVDKDGCPVLTSEGITMEVEVLFDTDKADIKPQFMAEIQRVAEFMGQYPNAFAVIEGHTDSTGEASYNEGLSLRRADAVRAVMVEKFGIDTKRITAEGYGEERPRATNETSAGREQNRRVMAVLKAKVDKEVKK